VTVQAPTHPPHERRRPRDGGFAVSLLADLVLPLALYYGLRAAGLGVYVTLVIAAAAPAALVLVRLVRSRTTDHLALFTLTVILASTAVSLVSGDPRLLLAREGWLTALIGLWFLFSLPARRPLAFLYSRPLLERRTTPHGRAADWDELWDRLPRFRRLWRVGTALWGAALLVDSAVRVAMAYTLPVDEVPALNGALYGVTSFALIVITNVYYRAAGLYRPDSALYAPLDANAPLDASRDAPPNAR
jgi:hypothetical protein